MTTQVICDSSCNLPENHHQSLNIAQVPARINFFVGISLRNGADISDEEFYIKPMLHFVDGLIGLLTGPGTLALGGYPLNRGIL